jgi:hypothetical protein
MPSKERFAGDDHGELTVRNEHRRAPTMSAEKLRRDVKRPLLPRTKIERNGRFFEQIQQRPAGEIREITEVYRSS